MLEKEGTPKPRLTGFTQRLRLSNPYVRTLYIFSALSLAGGTIYGLYYGIFLYKNTFSLSILALDGLFGGFGTWAGYIFGVSVIKKLGYGPCFKLAFGAWSAVAVGTALVAHHIAEWFVLIAVLKAVPGGIFAATCDAILLREIKNKSRSNFLQAKLGLEFLVAVLLPSAVGALIRYSKGYELAFVLAGLVYGLAFLFPVKLPKPELSLPLNELVHIFKRPLYPQQAANRTLAAGFNQINAFVLMIVPFLILKDEMKVGFLTSAIALVAVAVSFAARKIKSQHKFKIGYAAYSFRGLFSLLFIHFWSAPALLVWQLVGKLATPLHDPLQQNLDIHNDKLILGDDVKKKALHINVLNNTLLLIGTTVAYGAFFLITKTTGVQQRSVLQFLIIGFALWRFANLTISMRINRQAQHIPADLVLFREKLPIATLAWRAMGSRVMKMRFQFLRYRHELATAR